MTWEDQIALLKESGLRPNPDIGGNLDEARAAAMRTMFAMNPSGCHIKTNPNLADIIKIANEANYRGTFSIEGGGGGGGGARAGAAPGGAAAPRRRARRRCCGGGASRRACRCAS